MNTQQIFFTSIQLPFHDQEMEKDFPIFTIVLIIRRTSSIDCLEFYPCLVLFRDLGPEVGVTLPTQ